jgi:acyl-CoA thioesterase YciA
MSDYDPDDDSIEGMDMEGMDDVPTPVGELALQTVAMPSDTNANGDIFGGWLVSQMDLAASIAALKLVRGRVTTVAIDSMVFLTPVHVGAVVSCYTSVLEIGRSSIKISVDVWINHKMTFEPTKVTEGQFVFVAIDDSGLTRPINNV